MEKSSITGRLEDASLAKARRLSEVPLNFQPPVLLTPLSSQRQFQLTLRHLASTDQSVNNQSRQPRTGASMVEAIGDEDASVPSHMQPGAIGLRELTLTPEQSAVVVDIIENRTAISPRPARSFPAGDVSLLR